MGSQPLKEVEAIGVDIDQTLYQDVPEMREWFGRSIIAKGAIKMHLAEADFATLFNRAYQELGGNTKALDSLGLSGAEIFDELWEELPLENFVKPDPKLRDMIRLLKERYRLFVITNGRYEVAQWKLGILGLEESLFEFVLACYDIGSSKPDKKPFQEAIHRLGIDAKKIAYVGDRDKVDILPAQQAGMQAVMVWGKSDFAEASIPSIYLLADLFSEKL